MFKCIVVGGGTAGWLSALYAQKYIPYVDITVIASSEIGILGAGEGTTPYFVNFLKEIDVPVDGVIKHAKGTFKNGIKFVNWNGDGKQYVHGFLDNHGPNADLDFKDMAPLYLDSIVDDDNCNKVNLTSRISDEYKIKIKKDTDDTCGEYALHFDANLLAKYLESVAISRGVKLIDDEVLTINNDNNGNVKSFDLKSGLNIEADFVFDCTGFKRLIIGNHFKTKWNSYKDVLPVNRAMPFFIEHDDTNIPPYTYAIAMKYGWVWKIPVQGRFGCGYVFDSSMVTDEQILEELTEYLGYEPTIPRVFNFEAGAYDQIWVKNCVAVGLSSGFIEPLEATSIWVAINTVRDVVNNLGKYVLESPKGMEYCNERNRVTNEGIVSFLYFHYISKRQDSEFWKTFTTKNKMPEFIQKLYEFSKRTFPKPHDFSYLFNTIDHRIMDHSHWAFSSISYYQVGSGIGFYDKNVAQKELAECKLDYKSVKTKLLGLFDDISKDLHKHDDYIKILKNV